MGLNDWVISGCPAERPFGAEARNRHVYQPRVDGPQCIATQIQGVHRPRAKVVYDHVSVSPAVYLLAHPVDYSSVNFAEGSVIVDMYRKYQTHWDKIKVIHYGVR